MYGTLCLVCTEKKCRYGNITSGSTFEPAPFISVRVYIVSSHLWDDPFGGKQASRVRRNTSGAPFGKPRPYSYPQQPSCSYPRGDSLCSTQIPQLPLEFPGRHSIVLNLNRAILRIWYAQHPLCPYSAGSLIPPHEAFLHWYRRVEIQILSTSHGL